jgi:hypothetical protein
MKERALAKLVPSNPKQVNLWSSHKSTYQTISSKMVKVLSLWLGDKPSVNFLYFAHCTSLSESLYAVQACCTVYASQIIANSYRHLLYILTWV